MEKQSFLQAEQKEWMNPLFDQKQHNGERNREIYSNVETGKPSISDMSKFTKMISNSESLSCPSLQSSSLYYHLLYFQIFWTKQYSTQGELPREFPRGTKSTCKTTLQLHAVPRDLALLCPCWPAYPRFNSGRIFTWYWFQLFSFQNGWIMKKKVKNQLSLRSPA